MDLNALGSFVVAADGLSEFGDTRVQGVTSLALVKGLHHGLDDRSGSVEIRLPDGEMNHVVLSRSLVEHHADTGRRKIDDTPSWHGIGQLN